MMTSGTRQASDHDQLVARDGEVDVFEVVRARASDVDIVHYYPTTQSAHWLVA
jgi:hypothetical protein